MSHHQAAGAYRRGLPPSFDDPAPQPAPAAPPEPPVEPFEPDFPEPPELPVEPEPAPEPPHTVIEIEAGETLANVAEALGIEAAELHRQIVDGRIELRNPNP